VWLISLAVKPGSIQPDPLSDPISPILLDPLLGWLVDRRLEEPAGEKRVKSSKREIPEYRTGSDRALKGKCGSRLRKKVTENKNP